MLLGVDPASTAVFFHRAFSARKNAANSAGVFPPASAPCSTIGVNVFFACTGTNEHCGDTDPHRAHDHQKLFSVSPFINAEEGTRAVVIDGKPRRAFVEHGVLMNDVRPGRAVDFHISFNSPPHVETYRLSATLLYGDFATEPAKLPRTLPGWIRLVVVAALVLLAFSWWRRGRSEEPFESDEPPKVLGMLLRILGLVWSIAGILWAWIVFGGTAARLGTREP